MNSYNVSDIWEQLLQRLQNSVSETVYNTIISPAVPLSASGTVFLIGVNNNFLKKWLEENYKTIIENLLAEITEQEFKLKIENLDFSAAPAKPQPFVVKEEVELPKPVKKEAAPTPPPAPAPIPMPQVQLPEPKGSYVQATLFEEQVPSNLNAKYTFDTFVIGNSNRFAYAAAQAVAAKPGIAYNPLFIYGGVGLGKTHLMHAIGNQIKLNNPNAKVLYISSEKFLNEIVTSIEKRTMENFKNKYRKIDCLIIDDIQFLEKRERTLEEFFHTFNALYEENKQIIISSDRLPKHIKNIEDRLRSRFECGLMADIQSPDLETRIAILRKKAELEGIEIPHDVITLVASSITTNIREIEGAYTKIVAYAGLMSMPITVELAKNILDEMGATVQSRQITYEAINEATAAYFKIKPEELFTKKRTQSIATARHIAMYLCRELIDLSYPRIGEIYGGRDHSTVIHAYDKISAQRKKDPATEKAIVYLTEQLKQ